MTLKDLGEYFGHNDNSSVFYSLKRVEKLKDQYANIMGEINYIRERC